MLSGVCIGANDLKSAGEFYDAVLATIGMRRIVTEENELGYAGADEAVSIWIVLPYDGGRASHGNGTQVMFFAENEDQVRAFHSTVLEHGGTDEGMPGPRDYAHGYFGAYCRDRVGNKLHVAIRLS